MLEQMSAEMIGEVILEVTSGRGKFQKMDDSDRSAFSGAGDLAEIMYTNHPNCSIVIKDEGVLHVFDENGEVGRINIEALL